MTSISLKTIGIVAAGVTVAIGAVAAMNIGASRQKTEFEGGITPTTLARSAPVLSQDMFRKVDAEEADRRATANGTLAEETMKASDATSYTAKPVIQLQGTTGDANDPAGRQPRADSGLAVNVEAVKPVEVVKAPETDYKVRDSAAAQPARPVDPSLINALRRGSSRGAPSIAIESYREDRQRGTAPISAQQWRGGGDRAGEPGDLSAPASTSPAAPASSKGSDAAPIMTIGPGSSLSPRAMWDFPSTTPSARVAVRYAEARVGRDRFGRIYDTARDSSTERPAVMVLPGDMTFATLLYGFNSEDAEQMPVFVEIHDYMSGASGGFLNGARLRGTLKLSAESAAIEFDQMIFDDGKIVPVSAIAVSPDAMRAGVAAKVDRHTLERYASLFVGGLLQGVGEAGEAIVKGKTGSGGNVIIIGNGGSQRDYQGPTRDEILMNAIKPVGTTLAGRATDNFSRPPTVSAPAGYGVGVVFLEPVTYEAIQ